MMKYLAFGLMAALLLDATVVRMFLVPSVMKLLGDDCWWAPRWARRLQNRIGLGEIDLPDERKRPTLNGRPTGRRSRRPAWSPRRRVHRTTPRTLAPSSRRGRRTADPPEPRPAQELSAGAPNVRVRCRHHTHARPSRRRLTPRSLSVARTRAPVNPAAPGANEAATCAARPIPRRRRRRGPRRRAPRPRRPRHRPAVRPGPCRSRPTVPVTTRATRPTPPPPSRSCARTATTPTRRPRN